MKKKLQERLVGYKNNFDGRLCTRIYEFSKVMKHCTIQIVYQTRYFKASGIVMLDPGRGLGYPSYFCSLVLIFGPVWIIHGNIFLENPIYNIVAFACTCSNTQITLQKFLCEIKTKQ